MFIYRSEEVLDCHLGGRVQKGLIYIHMAQAAVKGHSV